MKEITFSEKTIPIKLSKKYTYYSHVDNPDLTIIIVYYDSKEIGYLWQSFADKFNLETIDEWDWLYHIFKEQNGTLEEHKQRLIKIVTCVFNCL